MRRWLSRRSRSDFAGRRRAMVDGVMRRCSEISAELGLNVADERVLAALADVPRHEFVPASVGQFAYCDRPLAIGHGQTISQPTIVAVMSALLGLRPCDRVLEIGTGSGYQAAILSAVAGKVFSMEVNADHCRRAQNTLDRLGYDNVTVTCADGAKGWSDKGPFDSILVTAAPAVLPAALSDQLAAGGRMVVPIGDMRQRLVLIQKDDAGEIRRRSLLPVRFVPMVGAVLER